MIATSFNATASGIFHIAPTAALVDSSNSIALGTVGSTNWQVYCNGSSHAFSPVVAPTTNTWFHIAVVRKGTTTKVYINGVQGFSGTDTKLYSGTFLNIGCINSLTNNWIGYIDDFRVTKGVALYTTTFTPPASALTL